ncbi:MAG: hypothetical protein PWQ61_2119 [Betaproteobacteria bacterium]|nr:hypothetical protein [Betaproteobacteria bacterium]
MERFYSEGAVNWRLLQDLPNAAFTCGFCNATVSSVKGYKLGGGGDGSGSQRGALYVCPNCGGPSFFTPQGARYPSPAMGNAVGHVPANLDALYQEARRSTGQNCFTGAVLLCRKMLMNIAVQQGAAEGLKFIEYVNYISDKGYVPPNGKHWVDHIRKKGNEATHEIAVMTEQDARELISFVEMLLRFIYEFPSMVSNAPAG